MIQKIFFSAILALYVFLCFAPFPAKGQTDDIPQRPNPPRLVNDFAGLLSNEEQNLLEQKLVEFNNATSTQIAVVIVKSLEGYEPIDMATRIIEKWGIGQKDKNNGLIILIKPKTQDEHGKVAISTGYGVEHVVTDALSKRIIDNEMIPSFKNGAFYEGIDKAASTLMSYTRGEFTADEYMARTKSQNKGGKGSFLIVLIILAIAFIFGRGRGGSRHIASGNIPFWLLMGAMSSGRGGGFGNFSSGGGGFGGFGGGSGGGGGASGSW
jgi:uncharacterized protein